jgi:hypothetical protein
VGRRGCDPGLKKETPADKASYRLVTCLSVLSNVLEKIICGDQITAYMESNGLLPPNQHGFKAGRSTLSALSAIQQVWANNILSKLITGVFLWNLSVCLTL